MTSNLNGFDITLPAIICKRIIIKKKKPCAIYHNCNTCARQKEEIRQREIRDSSNNDFNSTLLSRSLGSRISPLLIALFNTTNFNCLAVQQERTVSRWWIVHEDLAPVDYVSLRTAISMAKKQSEKRS